MKKYFDYHYSRPDYQETKKMLNQCRADIPAASSYAELRRLWFSMRESMQYIDFLEQYAYTNFLNGTSFDFYKEEVRIQDTEEPGLEVLQRECEKELLHSPYAEDFSAEFGDKIIRHYQNQMLLSNEQTCLLQTRESGLNADYIELLSKGRNCSGVHERSYEILDSLIQVRSEIAKTLGFQSYVEMAYRLHGRFDYGQEDIRSFRSQIQKLITPVCADLRKTGVFRFPKPNITEGGELISFIKNMFHDISEDSGSYIDFMLSYELYDIGDRPEKRSDYFGCCMQPYIKAPVIIGSFHGSGQEVNALIHEFGHGYAFYSAAREQKLWEYHRAVTSINEVHSKAMEHFAYPYLTELFGEKMDDYIYSHLYQSFDNLPYRCAIDEFEHALYSSPELSGTQRCEMWAEIERNYMPWRICDTQAVKNGNYWPNQSHLFTHPFYYIEYDIAQISVFEFYGRSKRDYGKAWKDYSGLCHAGGSKNYLDLLKKGDLTNPFQEGAVDKICRPVLDELYRLRK